MRMKLTTFLCILVGLIAVVEANANQYGTSTSFIDGVRECECKLLGKTKGSEQWEWCYKNILDNAKYHPEINKTCNKRLDIYRYRRPFLRTFRLHRWTSF